MKAKQSTPPTQSPAECLSERQASDGGGPSQSGAKDSFDALAASLSTPKGMALMGLLPESAAARTMLGAGAHEGLDEFDIMTRLLKESRQPESQRIGSWERLAETQAKTLDCLFHRLIALGFANIKNGNFHPLLKLAFRAQAQSARALETLATLRQPAVFAKQVNIGQQQVVANGMSFEKTGQGPATATGQGITTPADGGAGLPALAADGGHLDDQSGIPLVHVTQ